MATINKRVRRPQANVVNGVDAGGMMTARIQKGYDEIVRSAPDGLQALILDRVAQFCRGDIASQDWVHAIELLTGTLGTCVFYERKSGAAELTGFVKHTLTAPVIHRIRLSYKQGQYATVAYSFECRAADETKGFADMHAVTDDQAAPTYISAARGGFRIEAAALGALSIYHVTAFDLEIALQLVKRCNDGDVGYTCVDAELTGMTIRGSISFEDMGVTASQLKAAQLLAAERGSLVLTLRQSGAAADKTLTIAGVQCLDDSSDSDANNDASGSTVNFEVTNDSGTPLTLAGANKILTIA